MFDSHHVHSDYLVLKDNVKKFTGFSTADCYQCGKCSAGCPLAGETDYAPNQVMRLLQFGLPELDDKALSSEAIWLCLACETCSSRCPKDVEIPQIMDYLRHESVRQNKVNKNSKDIVAFHNAFLNSVKSSGRLFEVGLIMGYKSKTWHLMQDVNVAPGMLKRGKLGLLPHKIKNTKAISKIFEKSMQEEEQKS